MPLSVCKLTRPPSFQLRVFRTAYFMGKWQERLGSDNALVRYKAKQLIEIIAGAEKVTEFDIDPYFAMVEKMTVYDGGQMVVSLLDKTEVECEFY
jgi:site-specific DNA recombinase